MWQGESAYFTVFHVHILSLPLKCMNHLCEISRTQVF